jgi:hypothetical protein
MPQDGEPQQSRRIGNKGRINRDEAIPAAEPGVARLACCRGEPLTSPCLTPRTPMREERNTLDSLSSMSETRPAIINVEGCVPWENFTVLPNTLRCSEIYCSHVDILEQAEGPAASSQTDRSGARPSPLCISAAGSETLGRFRACRQPSIGAESRSALGRLTGPGHHPDVTESRAALALDIEPSERPYRARPVTPDSLNESNVSLTCLPSGSQSQVSTGGTATPTTTQSAPAKTESLACVICHKSFARPCQLT